MPPVARADVLHYWDAAYGLAPLVGGDLSFARDGGATFVDRQKVVRAAIARLPRFEWATVGGVTRPVWLGELARTNAIRHSRDLTLAPWGGSAVVSLNAAGLDGTANAATTLTDNDGTLFLSRQQSVTIANDSLPHVVSFWVAKDANSARFPQLRLSLTGGTTAQARSVSLNTATGEHVAANVSAATSSHRVVDAGAWWRVDVTVTNNTTGNTTAAVQVFPSARSVLTGPDTAAATGSIVIGQVQVETNTTVGTSPIFTGSASASRLADSLSYGYPHAPQALTAYVRFVEGGTAQVSNARVLHIGAPANSSPRLFVYNPGGGYRMLHTNAAGTNVLTNAAPLPVAGDTVELRGVLNADGSVQLGQSINGATESMTPPSSALALSSAWSDRVLWLNSVGTGAIGRNRFAELKIVKGAPTLQELRDLVLSPAGDLI